MVFSSQTYAKNGPMNGKNFALQRFFCTRCYKVKQSVIALKELGIFWPFTALCK